jgi:hypothetical protein
LRTLTRSALAAALVLAGSLVAVVPAQAAPRADSPSAMNRLLAQTRAGVAKYHDLDAALAAGYVPISECVEVPGVGAMGVHYLNPALVAPGAPVDAGSPQMLTYGPSDTGEPELWAAEFFQPDVGQPTPMYGSQPFDGPMPGHGPGAPVHYDLHVWVGKHNPDGVFAEFNPALHC